MLLHLEPCCRAHNLCSDAMKRVLLAIAAALQASYNGVCSHFLSSHRHHLLSIQQALARRAIADPSQDQTSDQPR